MPVVHDGGSGFTPPPQFVVIERPSTVEAGQVVKSTVTVQEAVAETAKTIQTIPIGTPGEGFPANATRGRFYEFASQPDVLYWLGSDNVWRAISGQRVS